MPYSVDPTQLVRRGRAFATADDIHGLEPEAGNIPERGSGLTGQGSISPHVQQGRLAPGQSVVRRRCRPQHNTGHRDPFAASEPPRHRVGVEAQISRLSASHHAQLTGGQGPELMVATGTSSFMHRTILGMRCDMNP